MKRKLLLTVVCPAFFAWAVYAQDIIITHSGKEIKAKVTEIDTEQVRYRKAGNPSGPDYVIYASDISVIKYESGSRDVFTQNPATGEIQIRHFEAGEDDPPAKEKQPARIRPQTSSGSSGVYRGSSNLVELLENKIVEAEITGKDITQVSLRIRRLVPDAVEVQIPAGSFFVSENPAAQNMVATVVKKMRLTFDRWTEIPLPAAGVNRSKDIPGSSDRFSVRRAPDQKELAQLMKALEKSDATTPVKQAAVWIVTDNADFDDLGSLTAAPGNTRTIGYEPAARAMKICAEAGIDITGKNIWNDRETIASRLQAGELKNWLQNSGRTAPAPKSGTAGKKGSHIPASESDMFELPVPADGETLYEGTAVFKGIDVKDFRVVFLLSADHTAIHSWKVMYKEFKFEGKSMSVAVSGGNSRFTVGKDTSNLDMQNTKISGLVFVEGGAMAKVQHTYSETVFSSGKELNFGTAAIVFKILKGTGPKIAGETVQIEAKWRSCVVIGKNTLQFSSTERENGDLCSLSAAPVIANPQGLLHPADSQ